MSETRPNSLAYTQGNRAPLRNEHPERRWFLALLLSLLGHLLFWGLRHAMPVPEVKKMDISQSMNVTLVPATIKSTLSEPKLQTEAKIPPQILKPKLPPKPKATTPKPVIPKSEEPHQSKPLETRPTETSQEQATSSSTPEAPATSTAQRSLSTAEPSAGHFEGPKLNADYLHNPRPDYPAQAKRMGWEGRVVLRVEVLANGSAGAVSLAKSSGHELLDEAALEAVRRWKFVPAKRDGIAVTTSVNVPINFNLKNE